MTLSSRLAALAALALLALAAPPLRAEPVSIHHDGVALAGELRVVSAGGLADGAVVLVHGTLAHHRMELIATLQDLLAERDLNSLAITLSLGIPRREGMYDCAVPHAHRHTDAAAEIDAWLGWLAARGAGPVTLLGHSRGGNQVARHALAAARAPRALVLLAPASFNAERAAATYRARNGEALRPRIEAAAAAAPDAWLDGVPFLYCGPSRVAAGTFLSYHRDDGLHDTPSLLPRLPVPTLVIAGSADTTIPDVAARAAPHLDGDTRLVVVDGADHFFRDLYAEDVADAVAAFVATLP